MSRLEAQISDLTRTASGDLSLTPSLFVIGDLISDPGNKVWHTPYTIERIRLRDNGAGRDFYGLRGNET